MAGGLPPDRLQDGSPQGLVIGPSLQKSAQVRPILVLETGLQEAGDRQPQPVTGGTEGVGHGADEAHPPTEAGEGHIPGGTVPRPLQGTGRPEGGLQPG